MLSQNKNKTKVYQVRDLCTQLALKVSKKNWIKNLVYLIKYEKVWKPLKLIFKTRNTLLTKNKILSKKNLKKIFKK